MADHRQAGTNAAGIGDSVTVELNGQIVQGTKGPDPAVWGEAQLVPNPDEPQPDAKGPDPAVWGVPDEA